MKKGASATSGYRLKHKVQRIENKTKSRICDKIASAQTKSGLNIPFHLYDNRLIFLKTRVNGSEPLWFILDTAATKTLINEKRARALGLRSHGKIESNAAGSPIETGEIEGVSFSISGVELNNQTIAAASLDFLEPIFGRSVDGIFGYEFFNRFVVEINYADRIINVYDPKSYAYSGNGESIQMRVEENTPYVSARIEQLEHDPIEGEFSVDTGYNGALLLSSPLVKARRLLDGPQKTIPVPAAGIGSETKLRSGRVRKLELGKFLVKDLIADFSLDEKGSRACPDHAGLIGGELLRRFKVILVYSNERMILEPNAHFSEPFEENMSGLSLISTDPNFKTFKIFRILEDSPASESGLLEGDILTAIDGKPATKFTLEQVRRMFEQEGWSHSLRIKRGATILRVRIKLRRLI